jgi:hypothetical protein
MTTSETIIAMAAATAFLALPAHAGGTVIIEEPEVIAPERQNVLPLIIGLLILGAVIGSGGDEAAPEGPKPCPKTNGGGC